LKHSGKCFSGHVPGHLVVLLLVTTAKQMSRLQLTQALVTVYHGNLSWDETEVFVLNIGKFGKNSKMK